jgi:hypothetical protein
MPLLAAAELWERGLGLPPASRALALAPETAGCPVGARDAALVALRERAFGERLVAVAICRACGERLELDMMTAQLAAEPATDGQLEVAAGDVVVRFRLPRAEDLVAIEDLGDVGAARAQLLERCVVSAQRKGRSLRPRALPARAVAAVCERMAAADPQADTRVALCCPACGAESDEPLDIGTFLWRELEAAARRLLQDVSDLARAYGWTEDEVLRLTPSRRAAYLELATA